MGIAAEKNDSYNHFVIVIISLAIATCLHLIFKILKPKEKIDTKAFDNLIDDAGWAEHEEEEEKAPTPATPVAPTPTAAATPALSTPAAAPRPPKVNDGPYNIGDRVILKGLMAAKDLNGRHGVIADLWDKKTQRYPVDLDLFDETKKKPLSVKVCNLEKEPPIPPEMEAKRTVATNGILDPYHGKVCSFIFNSLRGSVSQSLKGEQNPMKLAAFGWQFWQTPDRKGMYPALRDHLIKGGFKNVEDLETKLRPENPKGSYDLVKEAMTSPLAVGSWNVRIHGDFYIVGMCPKGTLLVPANNTRQVYCVLGFVTPLAAQMVNKFPRPPKMNLTLLPWFGRLVHDPVIRTTTNSNQVELASPELAMKLVEATKLAEEERRIIDRLTQLEVPDGSKEGLPFIMPTFPVQGGPPGSPGGGMPGLPPGMKMEPATEEERCLVENLTDFEPFPTGPNGQPSGPIANWNFIRAGGTDAENPQHRAVVLTGDGKQLAQFQTAKIVPNAVEILKTMLTCCTKVKKRPNIMGIDHPLTCARLGFLMQGIQGTKPALINVKIQKRTNNAAPAGGENANSE